MERPAFLGLPDGPVYSDDELMAAFEAVTVMSSDQRWEFGTYMRNRREARAAVVAKPIRFGGLR